MRILATLVKVEMLSGRKELGLEARGFFVDKGIFFLWSGVGKRDDEMRN